MGKKNIAIQGIKASFHDVAARKFFQSDEVVPVECLTFKILCEKLQKNEAHGAVMAIENTIAGSILTNYSLLERYQFKIVGEVYLRIELSLMALAGQKIEDLRFVQSHPMALLQSEEFLFKYPQMKIVEAADTAESAQIISDKKLLGHGAIASSLAAEVYGLQVLKEGIETNKQNYTRFLVIENGGGHLKPANTDKASLRFETRNEPGSLVKVLNIFKDHKINMTKIQSVPILGRPYDYSIHVDIEWDDSKNYHSAMIEFDKAAQNTIHFGEYKKGERPGL